MPKKTISIRLPAQLIDAVDTAAAARGVTRSQFIVRALNRALAERTTWSPEFLKAIGTPRHDLSESVDTMMDVIRSHRSRNNAPDL